MVGIGHDGTGDLECLVPLIGVIVHQNAHQFRDRQNRMGIVQLHADLVAEIVETRILSQMRFDDAVDTGADEEILLLQTQVFSFFRTVVRIYIQADIVDGRKIFAVVPALRRDICRFRRPKTQRIRHFGIGTDHGHIIRNSQDMGGIDMLEVHIAFFVIGDIQMAVEFDIHGMLRFADLPRIADPEPVVRHLHLFAFGIDHLAEQTVAVTDAVAVDRIIQSGSRVHKARRQTSQTPIAETRIHFQSFQTFIIDSEIFQTFHNNIVYTKVLEVVCQHTAEKELHGEVIHLFGFLGGKRFFGILPVYICIVADHRAERHILFGLMGLINGTSIGFDQPAGEFFFEL